MKTSHRESHHYLLNLPIISHSLHTDLHLRHKDTVPYIAGTEIDIFMPRNIYLLCNHSESAAIQSLECKVVCSLEEQSSFHQ